MSPLEWLALLSAIGVAALFIALALFLAAIAETLEDIGGPATRFHAPVNHLSKIRLGVRAIEMQTGGIAPQVTTLNTRMMAIRDGLRLIDQNLAGINDAVSKQRPR